MPTKTVRLQVHPDPDVVEAFMSCLSLHSLELLKTEQAAGYQFMTQGSCFFEAVLTKPVNSVADSNVPKTLEELRSSPIWRSTLHLLAKKKTDIMVAEGEAVFGRYQAVVINGHGFQLEDGASGMGAAYSDKPTHTPLKGPKKLLKAVLALSQPMSDDPPGTRAPTESEIVAKVFKKIEELRASVGK